MSRRSRDPALPTPLVPALVRHLPELAERFEVPADADEVAADADAIDELLAAASSLRADPFLALRLPAELPFRKYAILELAARASATLWAALKALTAGPTHIHPAIACELVIDGSVAAWHQSTPAMPRGLSRHAHDYALAYVVTAARTWLGANLPLRRVWFAHPRPRDLAPLARWFGVDLDDLAFGEADSGFAFDAPHLYRPLVTADPRLLATLTTFASSPPAIAPPATQALAPQVAAVLLAALPDAPTAVDVADRLHMSARTLQRRLDAEGTTFSAVADTAREQRARALLADPSLPLGEVAYRLGFADLATFGRAFKRWTGMSPGRARSAARD